LKDRLHADRKRKRDTVANIARPFDLPALSTVGTSTRAPAAAARRDQIERDRMIIVREAVELEPEHVGRKRGDALDRLIGGGSENEGNAGALRRLRQIVIRAGPHQTGRSHRATPIGAA